MKLSVLVCTYKRPDLIAKLLADMEAAAAVVSREWELIVVDNADDAGTKEACHSSQLLNKNLQYFHEPKTGLSSARNRAVKESVGEYLLFLDDDVSFEPNFIKQMLEAIGKYNVDVLCPKMITQIEPQWPNWLQIRIKSGVGQFNLGEEEKPLNESTKIPVGACMCIRRMIFESYGPFNENLGRNGKKLFGGEESLLFSQAFANSATGIYVPSIVIRHEFVSGKSTKKYWRNQGFYGGRSRVRMLEYREPEQFTNRKLGLLAGTSIVKSAIRFVVMAINPKEAFENQYRAIAHFGIAYEAIATIFTSANKSDRGNL